MIIMAALLAVFIIYNVFKEMDNFILNNLLPWRLVIYLSTIILVIQEACFLFFASAL